MKKLKIICIVIGVIIVTSIIMGKIFVKTYNSFVESQENINLAMANVETMMQRRAELIPDLVATVKAYDKHEEIVFEGIANARAALTTSLNGEKTVESLSKADNNLSQELYNMIILVENYPTLNSSTQYTSLMDQIKGSVNRVTIAREEYNEQVAKYNKEVRTFPTNIVANMFGFERMDEFEADDAAKKILQVDFND